MQPGERPAHDRFLAAAESFVAEIRLKNGERFHAQERNNPSDDRQRKR
jgi:hypothetical protein